MDQDSGDQAVVSGLRRLGVDVLTSTEAGHSRLPDDEQLQFATEQGRLLYTANVEDLARLHAEWLRTGRSHAGIAARVLQQLPVGTQIAELARICSEHDVTETRDRFFYI
jgi:phytoene/squalene synthetase